jgi:hypothetical protein
MHSLSSSFILGYHGCDHQIAAELLSGQKEFRKSNNTYDWLGPGVYFWESNPKRGFEFAQELKNHPTRGGDIHTPCVIGAIISLGECLDLTTTSSLDMVKVSHQEYSSIVQTSDETMPVNHPDLLRRELDCAVIKYLHKSRELAKLPAADTVRGIFIEGEPLYEGSGFHQKTHTQIAVQNLSCIKGVFRVSEDQMR